jgi:hypothetical protein
VKSCLRKNRQQTKKVKTKKKLFLAKQGSCQLQEIPTTAVLLCQEPFVETILSNE